MSNERARVDKSGMMESLESGGVRRLLGANVWFGESVAIGRRKEVKTAETDFVR